ncbi:MarR family transcriptional regulator [Enterocloster clostridioformis]|uniref:MarR family transcriptional regulator n=1 Tax=Enterocloster clostridioformis TaxID=1531 RepID=UPI001CE1B51A|nr:MarR family transcriptional regulator [Enterocloster clostridioformis]MCA5577324.1 MarR family transcriptional regulator [Enterocloster clostridioformis]
MSDYQLQIKQIVGYPRCRIYRQFIQSLINDRSIRTGGNSGLFYFTVLCSYANFRTSYRRIDGIGYTIYPGEWICTVKEMSVWFRTHFQRQAIDILEELQRRHLISYLILDRGKVIKYKIRGWKNHNTVLDYNCPCQKDTGFFFMPVITATELVSAGRCSEMDIILDLWLSTIYNDEQVQGSEIGPVVYLRNDTSSPLVNYSELAVRWGISKATVGRILKKFAGMEYISLMTFPGRTGSVIYLKNYLSTMFQISDVLIDKEEVAMVLNIKISLPDEGETVKNTAVMESEICVSNELSSVSKSHMEIIIEKMVQILDAQGISCFRCTKSIYKLYPLSDACREEYLSHIPEAVVRLGMTMSCGEGKPVYTFELTLFPTEKDREGGNMA